MSFYLQGLVANALTFYVLWAGSARNSDQRKEAMTITLPGSLERTQLIQFSFIPQLLHGSRV